MLGTPNADLAHQLCREIENRARAAGRDIADVIFEYGETLISKALDDAEQRGVKKWLLHRKLPWKQ